MEQPGSVLGEDAQLDEQSVDDDDDRRHRCDEDEVSLGSRETMPSARDLQEGVGNRDGSQDVEDQGDSEEPHRANDGSRDAPQQHRGHREALETRSGEVQPTVGREDHPHRKPVDRGVDQPAPEVIGNDDVAEMAAQAVNEVGGPGQHEEPVERVAVTAQPQGGEERDHEQRHHARHLARHHLEQVLVFVAR